MNVVNEENEDEEMTDHTTVLAGTMPMQASACLVAKLKKFTNSTPIPVSMMIKTEIKEMDIKDLKKRAQAITPITRMTTATKNDT